jgi:hypothetical protein
MNDMPLCGRDMALFVHLFICLFEKFHILWKHLKQAASTRVVHSGATMNRICPVFTELVYVHNILAKFDNQPGWTMSMIPI